MILRPTPDRPPERWCPRCRMRWRVPLDTPPAEYHMIRMSPTELRGVRNAARLFDDLSGTDRYSAEEFILWLSADVREV